MRNLVGEKIAQYKIMEVLGQGGMGVVYKAHDTRLDRIVALKFLPSALNTDPQTDAAIEQEAKIAATLNHPNIVTIYEVGAYRDSVFIAMEFVPGQSLLNWIAQQNTDSFKSESGGPPVEILGQCLAILIQVCEALEEAHQAGIIHRDVKPSNILVTDDGKIKIVDFGLALSREYGSDFVSESSSGTLEYLAPEQAKAGRLDGRTDIWAVGVLFYKMICGRAPFSGEFDQTIIYSILNEEPLPIKLICPEIPDEIISIIDRCLQKNPADRFKNIIELKNALLQARQQLNMDAPNRTFFKWPNTAGKIIISAGLILLLVILVFIFLQTPGYKSLPVKKHLAVLPLKSAGLEKQDWLYSDGVAEALSSKLTQLEQSRGTLWVVPFDEVYYRGINTPSEARKEFGVNLAITGSFQRLNEKIILTLNLVDTKSLRQLKSLVIEDQLSELFNLQKKLIFKMADMLELNIPKAREQFISAGFTSTKGAYDYYLLGIGYLQHSEQLENLNNAISNFKIALDIDPDFVDAHTRLAEAFLAKYKITKEPNSFDLAVESCNQAILLADKNNLKTAEVYIVLGLIQQQKGNYRKAKKSFLKAIELDDSRDKAYRELALTYQSLGDSVRAEAMLKKAIQLKPGYWENYNQLGVFYYRQTKYRAAAEQFKEVIRYTPDNIRGYNNLGGILVLLNKNEEAIKQFKHSLSIKANDLAYRNLGTLYFYRSQFEKAAKAYQSVLQFTTDDYRIWGALAESFYWSGADSSQTRQHYQQAVSQARRELHVNSQNTEVLIDLAGYYAKLNKQDSSRYFLNQVLSMSSNDVEVWFRIATVFEFWGERSIALKWLARAIKAGFSKAQVESYPGLKKLRTDARYKLLTGKNTSR